MSQCTEWMTLANQDSTGTARAVEDRG